MHGAWQLTQSGRCSNAAPIMIADERKTLREGSTLSVKKWLANAARSYYLEIPDPRNIWLANAA